MMKILVTGSSGNIGSKIAEVVSKHATCIGVDLIPGKFTTHIGDICDTGCIEKIIYGVDAVIHSAAYLTPHVGIISEKEFRRVNVHGTETLLDLALKHKTKNFVFTSTTSVYGCSSRPKTEAIWVTEDLSPNPEDIYDYTKLDAEKLCREAESSGMSIFILRMSRCFTEPDPLFIFYRLYRGVGRQDVAKAHWLAATTTHPGVEILNISAESPFRSTDMQTLFDDPWSIIDRIYPEAKVLYDQMKWEKPLSIDRVYVIEKAQRTLHYDPQEGFWTLLKSKTDRLLQELK